MFTADFALYGLGWGLCRFGTTQLVHSGPAWPFIAKRLAKLYWHRCEYAALHVAMNRWQGTLNLDIASSGLGRLLADDVVAVMQDQSQKGHGLRQVHSVVS